MMKIHINDGNCKLWIKKRYAEEKNWFPPASKIRKKPTVKHAVLNRGGDNWKVQVALHTKNPNFEHVLNF
jgi:hypothetical protein